MSCIPEEKHLVFIASGRNRPAVDSREMMKFYPNRTITGKFELLKFIAVGDGIFYKGVRMHPGNVTWRAIAYGNGRYVTIGYENYVSTSTDGINWTTPKQISLPNNDSNTMSTFQDIVFGNGKFVLISGSNVYTAISTDGINWNISPRLRSSNNSIASITFGKGIFVGTGYGWFITSTDGINWTSLSGVGSYYINDISFVNNLYFAVSGDYLGISPNGGHVLISSDGNTWDITQLGGKGTAWKKVLYGNGKYVIFDNKSASESTTGTQWSYLPTLPTDVRAAVYLDGKYIIALNTRECYYSTDARKWTQMPIYPDKFLISDFIVLP